MRAVEAGSPVPKHAQLRSMLLDLIEHEVGPDAAIPSERELMLRAGVSRMTVREAVGQLVAERRLYRVRGKGTFVAPRRVESRLHLASFTHDMRARGYQPGTVVLRAGTEPVPPGIALDVPAGGPAYRIERLRTADGVPMAVELGWYAATPAPGLLEADLAGSLYSLLADRYGLVIDRAEQTVWSEPASAELARLLGVGLGAPLLVFRRQSSAGPVPVEDVTSYYRGDRYQVHMSLQSPGGNE